MNNKNKMKRGKRNFISRQKKEELSYFASEVLENYFYESEKFKINYLHKKIKLKKEGLIFLTVHNNQLEWKLSTNAEEYIDSILIFKEEEDKRNFITALINDVILNSFKKTYINLVNTVEENSSSDFEKYKSELFYLGLEGIGKVRNIIENIDLTTFVKMNEFNGKHEKNFKLNKSILPIYLYKFLKMDENKRILKVINHPKEVEKDFKLKYIGNPNYTKSKVDFENKIEEFLDFLELLKDEGEIINLNDHAINPSLNLNIFNETTNIYDLYFLTNAINKSSVTKILSELNEFTGDNFDISDEALLYYQKFGELGISMKDFLLNHPAYLVSLEYKVIKKINKLTKKIESEVVDNLYQEIDSELEIPDLIRKDYIVYSYLKNFNVLENQIKVIEEELKILLDTKDNIDKKVLTNYLTAYKSIYKVQKQK
ncbi:hypothetical protein R6U76_18600 [Lysinibacillus capsici]|uniref:hypothetical protein n=1 Tax=Lysinibacillus TaxID=400634 RepID=UPI00258EE6F8|nr:MULTISPECIES: hypothetical protein [Lysinibacillus]WPK04631.1 hypothetical protein R6U76_18600 [Lysinibacillus capsici]